MKMKNTKQGLMAIRPEDSESLQTDVMELSYRVVDCVNGQPYGESALIVALGYWVSYAHPQPMVRVEEVCAALKATVASNLEAQQIAMGRGGGGES